MRLSVQLRKTVTASLAVAFLGLHAISCGDSGTTDGDDGILVVFAAASLVDVFADIETAFEIANPSIDVQINVAGSAALREQILDGAPADIFASANAAVMDDVVAAGATADAPQLFAGNAMSLAVPIGNPGSVSSIADLMREELLVGVCNEGVPCGDAARQILAAEGIEASIDTNEPDVKALLTKIDVGELDVGLVYVTDVMFAANEVQAIPIPADVNVVVDYPIVALETSPAPDIAANFVSYVLGAEGQSILRNHGFLAP